MSGSSGDDADQDDDESDDDESGNDESDDDESDDDESGNDDESDDDESGNDDESDDDESDDNDDAAAPGRSTLKTELAIKLEGISLGKYAPAFDEEGFRTLHDLGADLKTVQAAVGKVVKRGGDANRIVALWLDRDRKREPSFAPGQQLDLTLPSVTLDDGEFTIPMSVSGGSTGKAVDADELTNTQWLTIAKRNDLLYAVDLKQALVPSSTTALAREAAFVWVFPGGDPVKGKAPARRFFESDTGAYSSKHVDAHDGVTSRATNFIMDAHVNVSSPFVDVAVKGAVNNQTSRATETKSVELTGQWLVSRARVFLRECTLPSPALIEAMESAVSETDTRTSTARTPKQKYDDLSRVFDRFGQLVPDEVFLGGIQSFSMNKVQDGSTTKESHERSVDAEVTAKFGQGKDTSAGAGGGGKWGDAAGGQQSNTTSDAVWRAEGGDETLLNDVSSWMQSVKDPDSWKVVGRNSLVSIVDRLSEPLRAKVMAVWDAIHPYRDPIFFTLPQLNQPEGYYSITSVHPDNRVKDPSLLLTLAQYDSVDPYMGSGHVLSGNSDGSGHWRFVLDESLYKTTKEVAFFIQNMKTGLVLSYYNRKIYAGGSQVIGQNDAGRFSSVWTIIRDSFTDDLFFLSHYKEGQLLSWYEGTRPYIGGTQVMADPTSFSSRFRLIPRNNQT